ncbi:MAG: hypothetical protein Q4G09_04405 [Clostridia bacterium]|nr:hypothetical protein [Clostridia bacterium]
MYIISIRVSKRRLEVPELQHILTEYGKNIYARLGLHNQETDEKNGIIIIAYNSENVEEFVEDLNSIKDITANYMQA